MNETAICDRRVGTSSGRNLTIVLVDVHVYKVHQRRRLFRISKRDAPLPSKVQMSSSLMPVPCLNATFEYVGLFINLRFFKGSLNTTVKYTMHGFL